MDVSDILADLVAEQSALDGIVANLAADKWQLDTASPRWRVKEQIAHLTYFDDTAALAITDPEGFKHLVAELLGTAGSGDDNDVDSYTLGPLLALEPHALLETWRANRAALATAAETLSNDTRVPWYGPSMGSKSFLTARLMETWAHGQDIADAVGAQREPTDRLRHIAQLGFITRGWTYQNRKLDAPTTPIHLSLEAPSGAVWTFGPEDAPETVTGSAEDFCLVVTQRKHLDHTALTVTGESAREWLLMAQAFAGSATDGPAAS